MSELRPCTACDRHVAIDEPSCPFCAAPLEPAVPRPRIRGRLSRAAVFATATLATAAACGGGKAKPDPTKPDPMPAASADAGVPPADAAEVTPPHRDPDHFIPKPYGAPPARRRLV